MKDPADKLTLNNPARIHSYYTVRLKFTIIPKIYIFDDDYALVASANATDSGMRHNLECGLSTTDRSVVESLATSLMDGLGGGSSPSQMEAEELEELRGPVEALREALPEVPVIVSSDHEHQRRLNPKASPQATIGTSSLIFEVRLAPA